MPIHDLPIIQFNSKNAHEVIEIVEITRKENTHFMNVCFQELTGTENVHQELMIAANKFKYYRGRKINKQIPIAFAKYFVLGSLWWNYKKPLPPLYINKVRFQENFISENLAEIVDFEGFLERPNNSLVIPEGVIYQLKKPLFFQKRKENCSQVSFKAPTFVRDNVINFIVFPKSEIYRNFYAGNGINSLNELLLYKRFFDQKKEILKLSTNSDEELPIFLTDESHLSSARIIGNSLHLNQFEDQLRRIQNQLQLDKAINFSSIENLPIDSFKEMTVLARIVKSKEGEKGLFVMQIKETIGYTKNKYLPFLPKNKSSKEGGSVNIPFTKNKPNTDPDENEKPVLDYGGTSNDKAPSIEVDLIDMDAMTFSEDDIPVLASKDYTRSNNNIEGFYPDIDKNGNRNDASPPGQHPNKGGKKITNKKRLKAQDFFESYWKVLVIIKNRLESKGFKSRIKYFDAVHQFVDDQTIVNSKELRDYKSKINWELQAVQLVIGQSKNDRIYYFSLLEKRKVDSMKSKRPWLINKPMSSKIEQEEFGALLNYFLDNDDYDRAREKIIIHRLNCLQMNGKTLIDSEKSIENQGEKIARYILNSINH